LDGYSAVLWDAPSALAPINMTQSIFQHLSAPFSAYGAEGVTTGIIAGIIAAVFPLVRLFRGLEAAAEERRAAEHQRQLEEEARVQRAKDAEEGRLRGAEQARKAAEQARIAAEEARKVEEITRLERLRRERQVCQEDTLAAVNTSLCLFEAMTKNLNYAKARLHDAAKDYEDRAFAPFWDSIENATKQLAHFDDNLKSLSLLVISSWLRDLKAYPQSFQFHPSLWQDSKWREKPPNI
jgi:hypothetical protein